VVVYVYVIATNSTQSHLCCLSRSAVPAAAAAVDVCVLQATADGQSFPPITSSKQEVVDAAVAWVHEAIAQDRKIGPLKQLQGHVWRDGFKKGQLISQLFRWVRGALWGRCVGP
jgi:methionine salvage enolase-phosphatase E1